MARKTANRRQRSVIPTVIGAGITERWYFSHLQSVMGYRMKIRPRFFGTESLAAIDKKVAEVLRDGGEAICVFDADVASWNETEQKKLSAFKAKYGDNNHVLICDSLPSVEYWFLLHYVDTTRHDATSHEVIASLRKYIPAFEKKETFLQNEKWVTELCADGRLQQACARAAAERTQGQPYSSIHKAIKKFSEQDT